MAGTLNIVFNSQPSVGDRTVLRPQYFTNLGTWEGGRLNFDWVTTRTRSGEVAIGSTLEETVLNFTTAIRIDYSNFGGNLNIVVYSSTGSTNDVEIDVHVRGSVWRWGDVQGDKYFITYNITNPNPEAPKEAIFTGYDYGASNCTNSVAIFDVSGGTAPYNVYRNGNVVVSAATSPVSVEVPREALSELRFVDSGSQTIDTVNFRTPRRIQPADISLDIANSPAGATVTVNVAFISEYLFPLQYSLDNITYSEENVFTGQAEGGYTIFVKDAFGCVQSKVYTIDGVSTVDSVVFKDPSIINPFRWAKVEPGRLNRYNTLSYNQVKDIAYPFNHLVVNGDEPVNQIKTNAGYLNIYSVDCNTGAKTTLNPVKRSNHIGRTFKSTAKQFSTDNNLMGLYFGVVDVLDPLTDNVIESKNFGYQVPTAFDQVGRFVNVSGFGNLPVRDIIYDESYEAFIIELNVAYTGTEVPVTAESTYNIQNYEIYEFITPVSSMPDLFQIIIEAGLTETEISHAFISERIEKTTDSKQLIEINYWNTTNIGSMNYNTGIAHTIRLHSVLSRLADEQTVEGYNGDVERYNTSQEIFDGEEFIFGYLSDEMVRKVRAILAHDRLFINGVLYRLGEVPELNSRYSTNLCELTAILRKGGDETESFDTEIVQPVTGEGVDDATYQLEQAIAAAKNKALILWKK